MTISTTMTTKGQVTIPKEIRDRLGVKPGDRVIFIAEGEKIVIQPARSLRDFRGYFKVKGGVDMEAARKRAKAARAEKIKRELTE